MKMKQVCQLTGLTERTIRFYVEKELCAPETRWMDQRKYYDLGTMPVHWKRLCIQ